MHDWLCVFLDQNPANDYFEPNIVVLLTVLRTKDTGLYKKLVNGEKSPEDIMEILTSVCQKTLILH